jgi:hypothetical protein
MGCGICRGISQQLPADDRFFFGDLHVPAAGKSQGLRWALANGSRGFPVAVLPHAAAHRLVLDSGLRGWIGFATDPVGERCSRCCSRFAFPVHVCFVVVLLSVPATGDLRRLAGMGRLSHFIPRSFCFGTYDDGADDLGVEQRRFVAG